jgi:serine protease
MRFTRGAAIATALLLLLTPQPAFAADDDCTAAAKADTEAERGKILAAMPDTEGCEGPITVYADPAITPKREPLPGFAKGETRPVAAFRDADGEASQFVEDEILVSSKDDGLVAALAKRWKGTILSQFRPEKADETTYTIRVDTSLADPTSLSDNLAKLNDGHWKADSLAVSSKEALGLLTIAAQEAVDNPGLSIGVNWLTTPTTYATHSLSDAGTGPVGFGNVTTDPYDRNPYHWSYMNTGSVQDIGVAEAWTQMDAVGRLNQNTVDLTILDQGFAPVVNDDMPPNTGLDSLVPWAGAGDPASESWARWHGQWVTDVAAAVPGNFKGVAGPAGPVAKVQMSFTGQDMFTIMYALAQSNDAQLINMSFEDHMHWTVAWTLAPLEAVTWLLRNTGNMLLFASAGNENANVDGETCAWFVCWEKYRYAPCELSGVICVGGLDLNSRNRAPQSNYGHEDVDIFAPFWLMVGADPAHTSTSTARILNGTSLSSPFAAGVAALIWAADPNQDADTVEDILFTWLRNSPDSKVGRKVINALDAVRDAMPATIQITRPLDGWLLSAVSPSQFQANIYNKTYGTPTVTWRANGTVIGIGNPINVTPPPGVQTITATAKYSNGVQISDSVWVNVYNAPPTLVITNPTSASPAFGVSEPISFHVVSTDDLGALPDAAVQWFLDSATTPFATGHNPTVVTGGGIGTHTVKVRGCDSFTVCATASVPITLTANPVNQPPVVHITSPANGAHLWVTGMDSAGYFWSGTLTGTATDPEGAPLTTQWYDNGTLIGTGTSLTARLTGGCGIYGHVLTLKATDSAGNVRQESINTTVEMLC